MHIRVLDTGIQVSTNYKQSTVTTFSSTPMACNCFQIQ